VSSRTVQCCQLPCLHAVVSVCCVALAHIVIALSVKIRPFLLILLMRVLIVNNGALSWNVLCTASPAGQWSAAASSSCAPCSLSNPCGDVTSADLCPAGWWPYFDTTGVETVDSCYTYLTGATGGWYAAKQLCESKGSQLLTIRQSVYTGSEPGLFTTIKNRYGSTKRFYLGAARAEIPDGNMYTYSWVDGTPSGNLNCGSQGCGLWSPGEPKYVPIHVVSCPRNWLNRILRRSLLVSV
jgi:hypothetical protein